MLTRESSQERLAALATQGRTWKFVKDVSTFSRPQQLLEPPLEITAAMIRGLRMVDETVVVHGRTPRPASSQDESKGTEK